MKNPFKATVPAARRIDPGTAPDESAAVAGMAAGDAAAPDALRSHVVARLVNHVVPFFGSAMSNFTLAAPVILIAAIVLSVMAIRQTSAFISAFTREVKSAEVKDIAPLIDKKALLPADYQSAANVIAKNNSAVQVSLSRARNSIIVSIKEPALLPEFIYAMVTIQSYRTGVAWSAGHLCLNKCDGGNAAQAEITGFTQAISFSGLRPG